MSEHWCESVDENGCSWNQRDDDGDGIMNKFDQCPETLTETVSPKGCSEWQMDSDGDGVYDANDECANTGANQIANAKGCSDEQYELKGAGSDGDLLTSNMLVWVAGVVVVVLIGLIMMRRKESDGFEEAPSIEYPQFVEPCVMVWNGLSTHQGANNGSIETHQPSNGFIENED